MYEGTAFEGEKLAACIFAADSFPDRWVLETEVEGVRGLRRSTSWARQFRVELRCRARRIVFKRQCAPSNLNTRPARSAIIASALLLRAAPHDSGGPMWIAGSHWYDFYIRYPSPV
jgi:hypothetical protein